MEKMKSINETEHRIRSLEKEISDLKKKLDTVSNEERRLQQIFQESSIPTFVINKNHVVTHCNKAYEKLTGISGDKIIGTKNAWYAFYPKARPVIADLIVKEAYEKEYRRYYRNKNLARSTVHGGYEAEDFFPSVGDGGKWLFFTAAPLRDEDGNITGAIETLQDISKSKEGEERLRESERRLRVLLDFMPQPIVVFTLDGRVYYLNPAFTKTFGWTLDELEGNTIPYTPPGLEKETKEIIRRLFQDKIIDYHETKRLTKDGRLLDVVMRGAVYSEEKDEPAGEIVTLRDVTKEKRIARNNEAILRISTALPEYPDLEELSDYVSNEVKTLIGSDGALVILLDEETRELFFLGAAYDDQDIQKKVKEIRFPVDELVAGKVIKTGQPIIVSDPSEDPELFRERDKKLGYHTRNLLLVPLRSSDRIIGVLCAINKKEGDFDESDTDMLNMVSGTVALSIENARFSEELLKAYRNNEALLRISMAMPQYPDLEELLDYISSEVKRLLESEGSLVILLDEEKQELFFLGAAYDDQDIQKKVKEIRFPVDELVAGKVIKTGQPIIVSDPSEDPELFRERDKKLGYHTRNLLLVPLRSSDRIIGVLCAINKKEGDFDDIDVEMLNMVSGTVALSIENARFSEELKKAYLEVSTMNRAKDKAISHLSHELKTPIAVVSGTMKILSKQLPALPEEKWKSAMKRGMRNLKRIMEIQSEAEDIMQGKREKDQRMISQVLEIYSDQMESLIEEEIGEGPLLQHLKKKIEEIYGPKDLVSKEIFLNDFITRRIEHLRPLFSHRRIDLKTLIKPTSPINIPEEILEKVFDGLLRNAVENTPDEGRIEVSVKKSRSEKIKLVVRDFGVGITKENQNRIFEGFFSTQDTMDYSSKRPFDFNAGGKGADLLRMKIFSERYKFKIKMTSTRCPALEKNDQPCPGRIGECASCTKKEDCIHSGGTEFTISFNPATTVEPR